MGESETSRWSRTAAGANDAASLFGGGVIAALAASPRAEALVCEASRLAAAWGLSLTFLNVGGDADQRSGLTKLVRTRAAGAELVFAEGARVDQSLCAIAKERGAGLILIGALESEAGLAWYRGSVARRVARAAPCSVLLLAHPRVEPAPFVRPQVNVQGLERSRPLIALGLALARREHAQDLHLVVEYEVHGLHIAATAEEGVAEADRQALQHQEELALAGFVSGFDAIGLIVRRFCVPGRRGFAALEHAHDHGRDLLLWRAPTRRAGLLDKIFPHDTDLALRDLACPLLIYRPPRAGRKTVAPSGVDG